MLIERLTSCKPHEIVLLTTVCGSFTNDLKVLSKVREKFAAPVNNSIAYKGYLQSMKINICKRFVLNIYKSI